MKNNPHNEEHCHIHNHNHNQEEINKEISITYHEGAVICSTECVLMKDYQWVRDTLAKQLNDLASWVDQTGGFVGHIKAFLTEEGYSSMLSTTGSQIHIKEYKNSKVTMNLTIIVYIDNENDLSYRVSKIIDKLTI